MTHTAFKASEKLVDLLNYYFMLHPSELEEIKTFTIEKLRDGDITRIFDTFPSILLSPYEFAARKSALAKVIHDVSKNRCYLHDINELPEMTQKNINKLEEISVAIVHDGFSHLTRNNKLDPELVAMLGWHEFQNTINIHDLLCGYLGRVLADLIIELQNTNAIPDDNSHAVITDYVNNNLRRLIDNSLNRNITREQHHYTRDAMMIGAGAALAVMTGSVVLAAASGAGAGLFSRSRNASNKRRRRDDHYDSEGNDNLPFFH